jgi:hypothetical protein
LSVLLRITSELVAEIKEDLSRPHSHALERVGFLYCRSSRITETHWISFGSAYIPVPDQFYIPDPRVGARINSDAIRGAMQHVLDTRESALHVHAHEHFGTPGFSKTDRVNMATLLPAFANLGGETVHGGLLLSEDSASLLVYKAGMSRAIPGRVSIVGYPTRVKLGTDEGG